MQIENFKDCAPGSAIVATFDLYIPDLKLTINHCKVIRGKKGGLFPVLPSIPVEQPDGTRKFIPAISFTLEQDTEFKKAFNEAIKPFITNR